MSTDEVIWLRPEQATTGRPAERSRAEITAAAITVADRDGLDAVSMRKVAAELGTGAASLYRYVNNRDDLLDLMVDATGADFEFPPPTGKPVTDLVQLGVRHRQIMLGHPWLPTLVLTRPTLGPSGAAILEYFLTVLDDHPLPATAKLEAFALFSGFVAMYVHNETHTAAETVARQTTYLLHLATDGEHPQLAATLLAAQPAEGSDRFPVILARVLTGLLTI
ncbi:TetR/AcrR family transcriptional regulator [Stackebrandtia nassauensis]|uniref:Transcriptional regulator, TetR family n=1 Tax=Stackebrandtia nassauensis (strain DSM 44728 / CIP 108903 / NRRL B-16338 / NBRC 102104 / LLR-40K-21) TaxID=446470 RepID=D3Q300_STANL|nr:TetR/AcrR family transcriptional regulator [Stackebrandtia nassauensis]ADD39970.1 transcriptional regulator, TetR family [Stackebrandtia nassauensis DSM 44728]